MMLYVYQPAFTVSCIISKHHKSEVFSSEHLMSMQSSSAEELPVANESAIVVFLLA